MTFDAYIFNTPSLLTGMARVLDIGAVFDRGTYLISASPAEADTRATASDWRTTGADLQAALGEYEPETEQEEQAA